MILFCRCHLILKKHTNFYKIEEKTVVPIMFCLRQIHVTGYITMCKSYKVKPQVSFPSQIIIICRIFRG